MRWILLLILILLTGCSLAPSDEVMEALGKSERSWCIYVAYGPGMFRGSGSGIQGGSMTCTQEGMTIQDNATKIGVPLVVTPSISIGPPTIK